MKNQRDRSKMRRRVSLVNKYILIVALLWVVVLVALLLKAHPGVTHSKVTVKNEDQVSMLRITGNTGAAALR